MTMETGESHQDNNAADSVAESESANIQSSPGQNQISAIAQVIFKYVSEEPIWLGTLVRENNANPHAGIQCTSRCGG